MAGEGSLFEQVIVNGDAKASLESALNDWIADYEADTNDAMVTLINFLLDLYTTRTHHHIIIIRMDYI